MGLESRHPLYAEHVADWVQMRDCYSGERVVKTAGVQYLPPTSGMLADGMTVSTAPGALAYSAYRTRSRFPDAVKVAVESLLGVMHRKPPVIELPSALDYLVEKATIRGESLEMLLRKINEEQLVAGRLGLIVDVIDSGQRANELYLATYMAEKILNWDEGTQDLAEPESLNLVVLDESESERQADGFEWDTVEKYRVLILGDLLEIEQTGVYQVGVFRGKSSTFDPGQLIVPTVRGRNLDKIPFVFINSKDVVPEPDHPPLLGLSQIALGIYRGEADYRQALFMQGQDTLVLIGVPKEERKVRTGAGASIAITNPNGDAKYIGVDSTGLSEMRNALENDYAKASQRSGDLLEAVSRAKESGEALRVRVAARTATLNQVALAGAYGLQAALRLAAEWAGANPEEVIVTPNLDFADDQMTGKELSELMGAKMIGAPISLLTIHGIMEDRGMTELNVDEELAQIDSEKDIDLGMLPTEERDGPEDEEDEDEDEGDEE